MSADKKLLSMLLVTLSCDGRDDFWLPVTFVRTELSSNLALQTTLHLLHAADSEFTRAPFYLL